MDVNGYLSVGSGSDLFTAGTGLSWSGTTLNSVWTVSDNNIYNNNTANVGVGTNSPQAKLHIITPNLSGNEVSMRIGPVGGGSSTTSSTSILDFYSTFDNYSADQGPRRTASIKVGFNGSPWGSEYMSFHVGNNGSANDAAALPIERMIIAGNGNVGIGTTAPTEKLHVSGGEVFIRGDIPAGKPSLYVQARNGNWGIWAENEYGYTGGGGGFAAPSGFYSLLAVGGTKNAIVKTTQGATALFCMESTEVWFEDIGGAKLVDGQAYIKLDPIFLETVTIDEENPMRVFIQPNGETQGLIVIKETDGFRVIEQNNGTNNISFDYRVLAKRKYFETDRLTIWPKPNHQPNESEQKDIDYLKKTLKN